ncbi:orotidine-5'-phosphate decarboxylase [Raineya sp.]|mgnify:CR=1 FL=1|jgi:orotidine-5'-phosphate decarboxylase
MTYQQIQEAITAKKSFLCVGLDSDLSKLPTHLPQNAEGILTFNKAIIEATLPFAIAYKINTAFYEALGAEGWKVMEKTLELLPKNVFKIADAKRGDIGNTSKLYAKAFFETLAFDALTIAPYMGEDSVSPFLEYENKWVILLALTSNVGSKDFEMLKLSNYRYLYEEVMLKSQEWADHHKMMYVVGATQTEKIQEIRRLAPNHFLLVPGVGTQGGDLEKVIEYGTNEAGGLLINVSRDILFASQAKDFAEKAYQRAEFWQKQMKHYQG